MDVRIASRIAAPPERVFDAWATEQGVRRWMASPPGAGEIVRIEIDAREGGEFCFVARRGGEEIEHVGVYLDFRRPRLLVFTWLVPRYSKDMTRVAIELSGAGDGTALTLTHDGVLPEYESATRAGWTAILDAIAAMLAA